MLGLVGVLAGVVVATAAALRFTDAACPEAGGGGVRVCPSGIVGGSYSFTLSGDGGCGPALPYQYRVINGALPPGLSLSSGGTISGTATQSGTYSFWIELSDENPPSASWCLVQEAEREFSLTVAPGLSISNQAVKPGTIGVAYSETLSAMLVTALNPPTGIGATGLTWSIASGTLPAGLALATDGTLAGTPTAEGSYQFVVRAQGNGTSDTETLTLVVRTAVAVAAPLTPKSEVGVLFTTKLTASGGTSTFVWAATGLPAGLALGTDGTLTGTPTVAGTYRFTATATDTEARVGTYEGVLTVASRLAIKTLRLKPGRVGRLYKQKVSTFGGVLPAKWKVKGRLPRGIRFASALGLFTGTPQKAGTYRVTVEVTDALKVKSVKTFTIVVLP